MLVPELFRASHRTWYPLKLASLTPVPEPASPPLVPELLVWELNETLIRFSPAATLPPVGADGGEVSMV